VGAEEPELQEDNDREQGGDDGHEDVAADPRARRRPGEALEVICGKDADDSDDEQEALGGIFTIEPGAEGEDDEHEADSKDISSLAD
jgi:hypothetical protein